MKRLQFLLREGLHRHRLQPVTANRVEQAGGVCVVGLLPTDKGPHILRGQERDAVSRAGAPTRLVQRPPTSARSPRRSDPRTRPSRIAQAPILLKFRYVHCRFARLWFHRPAAVRGGSREYCSSRLLKKWSFRNLRG